jgi:hypothetical protein
MTVMWLAVTLAACVAGVAAGVWLLVLAYRQHVGWGLACTFVPFAVVAFAFRYWEEAKRPFALGIVGFAVTVVAGLGYSASKVNQGLGEYGSLGAPMDEASRPLSAIVDPVAGLGAETPADDEDPAPVEQDPDDIEIEPAPTPLEDAPLEDEEEPEPRPEEVPTRVQDHRRGVAVPVSALGGMIGELVQVHLSSGERRSVRIESVSDTAVVVRQRVGGGSIVFPIELDHIVEVRTRADR